MSNLIPLPKLLANYESALKDWQIQVVPSEESALKLLRNRDALQKALEAEPTNDTYFLKQVIELDRQLQDSAASFTQAIDLESYRHSLGISPQSWWWYLDSRVESDESEKWAWFWQGARFSVWTINLGLFGTLATRLFSGASGLMEVLTIALPSLLVLLQANNELTSSGREGFNRLFNRLKISPHLYEQAKFIPTVFIFFVLLVIWFLQPQFSRQINQEGRQSEGRGQLTQAEQHYLKAIALDPDNLAATYNLGNLYEELQNFENARKYYIIAVKGGLPGAYNNLARLYILQNKYAEAIILLKDGLNAIEREEKLESKQQDGLAAAKYSIFKNLGWAKFRQNQKDEAQAYLLVAISIASNPEIQQSIDNPGAAHCLLAQVLETQSPPLAREQWKLCYDLVGKRLGAGDISNPEEETWFSLAKQKLNL